MLRKFRSPIEKLVTHDYWIAWKTPPADEQRLLKADAVCCFLERVNIAIKCVFNLRRVARPTGAALHYV